MLDGFHLTQNWLELVNQWHNSSCDLNRLDQLRTQLEKFLDDSDSTKMTRAHHCSVQNSLWNIWTAHSQYQERLQLFVPATHSSLHWSHNKLFPSVSEVATFWDSAPIPKFLNPGPAIFQIWESDSGHNHRSNRNLPMFLLKKGPHRLLLLPKLKSDSCVKRNFWLHSMYACTE